MLRITIYEKTREDNLSHLMPLAKNDRNWNLKVPTSIPSGGCNRLNMYFRRSQVSGLGHVHVRDVPSEARRGRKCLESLVLTPGTILLVFDRAHHSDITTTMFFFSRGKYSKMIQNWFICTLLIQLRSSNEFFFDVKVKTI